MKKFSEEKAKNEHNKRQSNFKEEDISKIINKREELESKFKNQGILKKYIEEFKLLFSMIKDYFNKDYTEIPWYIIASIGATLLYVLSPIDLIPDFIPFVGYIDDVAVFAFCLNQVSNEVEKYKLWKQQ